MDGDSFKRDFILYDTSYQSVEVTGSWCDWQRGRHILTKIPGLYFITSVDLPYGQKVLYKYIINGEWKTIDSEPTETGSDGLVNNVFQVPEQQALDGPVIGSTSNPREEPVVVGPPTSIPHGQNIVGSGSSHTRSGEPMTENVEKVAPGVVEATPSGHGVSDRDLAKTDVGGATLESKHALANSAGTAKTDANAAHLSHSGVTGTESNVALVPNGSTAPGSTSSNVNNASGKPSYFGETREATPKAATGSYIAGSPASTLQSAATNLPSGDKVAETASNAAGTAAAGIAAAAGAVAGGVAGAAAVATASARDAVASVPKSTTSSSATAVPSSTSTTGTKAPLPAPTRDAPTAPGTHAHEGQGLFSAISHIASAATVAAQHAAERVVHAIEGDAHPTGTVASEGPRTATQTPAFGLQNSQASVPTVPSGSQVSSALKAHPAPTAQASSPKEPAAALAPITTNDGVAKITKELGSVDLQHTKLEVTHAVESLGGAIAGALASIGASAEGRVSSTAPVSSAKTSSGVAPALSSSAAPVPAPVTATNTSTTSDTSKPSYYGETREASPKAATGSYIGTGSSAPNGTAAPSAVKELKEEIASEVKQTVPTAPATSTGTAQGSASAAPTTGSNVATGASSAQTAAPAELKKEVASEVKQTIPTVQATSVGTATDNKSTTTPSSTVGKKEGSSFTDKLKRRVSKIDPSKDESPKTTTTPPVPTTGSAPSTPKKGSSTPSSRILPDNDKKLSTPTADLAKRGSAATASGVTGTAAADKTKPSTTTTAVPGAAKKETGSSLGVASGAGAASSLPPTTPKKSGVAEAGTPASAHTDGAYKTAPSTPATPADRKRKSSFFQKVKKAFSP